MQIVSYQSAIETIQRATNSLDVVELELRLTIGHFLAEPLVARLDSPRFDNSSVDGYGLSEPLVAGQVLEVVGEIKAGEKSPVAVGPGLALRVFTGAPLPTSVLAVAMQEDVICEDGRLTLELGCEEGANIRRAGDDFKAGQTLAETLSEVTPALIGLAAASGNAHLKVFRKPRIAILSCGNELLPVGEPMKEGHIPNSNLPALGAALDALAFEWSGVHINDTQEATDKAVSEALSKCDVLITTGGVSVGEYDLVKESFRRAGVEQGFWRVAIRPGMPTFFGTRGRQLIFGLPGNPVAALVTFFLFARPSLFKMMGAPKPWPTPRRAVFKGTAEKEVGRLEFMRGWLDANGKVQASSGRASHISSSLIGANCLILFPAETSRIMDGQKVDVLPLGWNR